jgi:hypothetical protein
MRRRGSAAVGLLLLAAALYLVASDVLARRRSSHKNPHAEITATAEVSKAPRRSTHSNGRTFEELEVRLLSVDPPTPPHGGFTFETTKPIRVVHDLTCGGAWVDARVGDRLDLRGEYVHTPDGNDLVHFTHPAGAVEGCGTGTSTHPDGYLRPHREAAAASEAPAAAPAKTDWAASPAEPRGIPESSLASFRQNLRPILSTRCAPCHEPGGKMYGRLPFDDPATVASHWQRMGTRLKGDDLAALKTWAAELDAATSR